MQLVREKREEPEINLKAANAHMEETGYKVIDPESFMARCQMNGMAIEPWASQHLAYSNRGLWRRIAQLEAKVAELEGKAAKKAAKAPAPVDVEIVEEGPKPPDGSLPS